MDRCKRLCDYLFSPGLEEVPEDVEECQGALPVVSCNEIRNVARMNWLFQQLSRSLPLELYFLSELSDLNLMHNALTGTLSPNIQIVVDRCGCVVEDMRDVFGNVQGATEFGQDQVGEFDGGSRLEVASGSGKAVFDLCELCGSTR